MKTHALVLTAVLFALPSIVTAQKLSAVVTKGDVERAAGAKFGDGAESNPGQITFQQLGGDMQISVELEPREAGSTVRTWEATLKKMQPGVKVDTVKGVGTDAIFHSTREDMGALSADFERPRVQLRVAMAGAQSAAAAQKIVTDLARAISPRIK